MFLRRCGRIALGVLILTMLCAAMFAGDAFAKKEGACSAQCYHSNGEGGRTHYYTEYECKKWWCGTAVDIQYDYSSSNSDGQCWNITKTDSSTYYCDRHKPKPKCPTCNRDSDSKHYEVETVISVCQRCGKELRRGTVRNSLPEGATTCTKKETTINVSRTNPFNDCSDCEPCDLDLCGRRKGDAVHVQITVKSYYMCGHTEETKIEKGKSGGCFKSYESAGMFCNGSNAEGEDCKCPGATLSLIGDVIDLADGSYNILNHVYTCEGNLGFGRHTNYIVTTYKCNAWVKIGDSHERCGISYATSVEQGITTVSCMVTPKTEYGTCPLHSD